MIKRPFYQNEWYQRYGIQFYQKLIKISQILNKERLNSYKLINLYQNQCKTYIIVTEMRQFFILQINYISINHNKNAQQYEPNLTLENSPNDKPVQKPITFEEIKLVSSVQVSGDGHYQSVRIICSGCKMKVNSVIKRRVGIQTCIAGILLIFCSFGFICVTCIPCLLDDCKDVQHSCPNCKQYLGKAQFIVII